MSRIACILIADFPLAAIVRTNPELRDSALAAADSLEGHAELIAVSARARASGIRPGMTIAQARALLPAILVMARSPDAERSAHDAILDAAESFSPIVEDGGPGRVWLDLGGLASLYGAEDQMAVELASRARRVGIDAAVGIGASKEVAWMAARCGGIRVIEAGSEREFLGWLPLDLLELDEDLELTLAQWGIRRLGELARIDLCALGTRLGEHGVELARLARGENPAPFVPRPRAETFAEAIELDYGIETLEPLAFVMRPMVERLTARLALRGFAAGDITISFGLADRRRFDRRVAVASPTNEVRSLLALVLLSLEASPPEAAIESIWIAAEARVPRRAQGDLFLPSPAPERLQTMIARLAAICGPDDVGTLKPANSWRPEAVQLAPFSPEQESFANPRARLSGPSPAVLRERVERRDCCNLFSSNRDARVRVQEITAGDGNVIQLVVRAIRPPEEIEVMCSRGIPDFVRGQSVCARVVSIAGPWRRQGEWWRNGRDHKENLTLDPFPTREGESPPSRVEKGDGGLGFLPRHVLDEGTFARDYYDIALADGGVYRMFRELRSGQWFLDGTYD
jgi:protein ImuB